jgi:3D (Asp-Asp-Asp) domain-containing protein
MQTLDTPGGQVQYWRAVQMYATSYSPCRSGTSKCSYGTASGLTVKHGVVAMTRDIYNTLAGTQVYVPGYGVAVIGDVGGGFPDGRLWIDLGYSDDDWQNWGGWVTVYFLAPIPAYIPSALQ